MKIIINGRFLIRRITGVERYAHELLNELDKIADPETVEIAVPPELENLPKYKNIKVVRVGKLHNRLWEHISFPIYAWKKKCVPLNLCNVAPLLYPGIVCLHDVHIKAAPKHFKKTFVLWYRVLIYNTVKRAKAIITVSEFSKKEILTYYNVNSMIYVVSSAWQHYDRIMCDEKALSKYELSEKEYFFSLLTLEPNKNLKWIAEVAKRNRNQVVAIAGSINKTVFAEGMGFECPKNMKLLGYVSDEEAKTLMRECKAFLFPTFYEGFGLPPLEALSAGTKHIIVSDTEVMREVYGDFPIYVDPHDPCIDIEEMIESKEASTYNPLEKYSWKRSAELLCALLKEVVNP